MNRIVTFIVIALAVFTVRAQETARVQFRVNVTDKYGRSMSGLKPENFRVRENDSDRKVLSATITDQAASVTILIDVSDSITPKLRQAMIRSASKLITEGNPGNDYAMIAFGVKTYPVADWKTPRETMKAKLEELGNLRIKGEDTGFYDGFSAGVKKASSGTLDRKVLVVYSDGQDNRSEARRKEIKALIKRSDLLIYCVSMTDVSQLGSPDFAEGQAVLDQLAMIGGGRAFFPRTAFEASEIAVRIADYLKFQYTIEWETTLPPADTKWRDVDIDGVVPDDKSGKLTVRILAREGYFPDYVRSVK
jgi:VWFA-related protein